MSESASVPCNGEVRKHAYSQISSQITLKIELIFMVSRPVNNLLFQ